MTSASFHTLVEMLAERARLSGERTAFTFAGQVHTYAELWQGVGKFSALIHAQGIARGERVVILIPNSAEFFSAFYGVQAAGGIPVPIFPESGIERLRAMMALCGADIVILPERPVSGGATPITAADFPPKARCLRVSDSNAYPPLDDLPAISPDDIAFIQYTSGSTGNPKGVQLTQRNLLDNIQQMIAGMEITAQDVFVSWLPVYHDMGLILMTMTPFYLGTMVHLLPAELTEVRSWLKAIEQWRATFTAAPDFAYRLCLRYIRYPEAYDLSSLRVALNAAEPVREGTVRAFEAAFRLRNVVTAGYGLAEATVGVSMSAPGMPLRVDERGLVSVGRPFPGVEVCIVDGEVRLPPGEIGEIAIRSIASSPGYFNNPAETRKIAWQDGFFLSGDMGYLDDEGYLYVAGRKKSIIKRSGTTIAPQEIEEAVDRLPFLRYSAAIGIDHGGFEGEQAYVFAELRGKVEEMDRLHDLAVEIVLAVQARMGFRPGRVYLLRPRSIPMTYNGKIQRQLLQSRYLDGSLRSSGAILYPEY